MTVIGLTGGIASGKTIVSNYLAELGAEIIDADIIARKIVTPGSPALKEIAAAFGTDVLNADGTLNRKKLGTKVFNDPQALKTLNKITHPKINALVQQRIKSYKESKKAHNIPLILVAPLLIEAGMQKLVDKVWVVHIDKDTQIKRVMARDKLTPNQALKRINSQLSEQERLKYADAVIDNTGTLENTKKQVLKLWTQCL